MGVCSLSSALPLSQNCLSFVLSFASLDLSPLSLSQEKSELLSLAPSLALSSKNHLSHSSLPPFDSTSFLELFLLPLSVSKISRSRCISLSGSLAVSSELSCYEAVNSLRSFRGSLCCQLPTLSHSPSLELLTAVYFLLRLIFPLSLSNHSHTLSLLGFVEFP